MLMVLQKVNDKDYKEKLKSGKAVLVLTLSYCPYCRDYKEEIKPVIKANTGIKFLEAEMDKDNVGEINEAILMPDYYPTAILFKDGVEVARMESKSGVSVTKEQLSKAIKKNFS